MIKAIETAYAGCLFRSRLEARWAVFFDALGVKWEYEREGFDLGEAGYYLPDFWLPRERTWVEIKAEEPNSEEESKAAVLCKHTGIDVCFLIGSPWFNIIHPCFILDEEMGVAYDTSCYKENEKYYDWINKREYYQGWLTWGIDWTGTPKIICLIERDDVRATEVPRLLAAYTAARSARFEHGETPQRPRY